MENYLIPLNGLTSGKTKFSWNVGKEFFNSFENSEILDADLTAEVEVEKSGKYLGVDCLVSGVVTVECDRCLEMLEMPVDTQILLSVKYGEGEETEEVSDGSREIVWLPQNVAEMDMAQVIYDYVCLSLPMKRHHPEGECNPDAAKYFGGSIEETDEETEGNEDSANPFASLKGLFD